MCYSAQIRADHTKFVRHLGATISLEDFYELYWLPQQPKAKRARTPRALDLMFADVEGADAIREAIAQRTADDRRALEQELFAQRARLAKAQRVLATKPTKKAADEQRIAGNKMRAASDRLAALARTTPNAGDARIFPGWYAPVIVSEGGRRVVRPMRYQCRMPSWPAHFDARYPGTYMARRDKLDTSWKALFGVSHGVIVANAFYENVKRHDLEGRELGADEREENVVLEFRPRPAQDMLVACLWSHWTGPDGGQLLSFAAISDEPPPEIAAAGHDRCIIPIKESNLDAWLNPRADDVHALQAILDDRERPYFEHRMAA